MSNEAARAEANERNRRGSFRMNDRVALTVHPMSENDFRKARGEAREHRDRRRTLNSIITVGENQRGVLRNIRESDPVVAAYLQSLEERLETLARLLGREGREVADTPTHDVNLSGNGISFQHDEPMQRGDRLSLELQLFPERTCLSLLGTVVRMTERRTARGGGRYQVAVDFTDIHDDDRELLIRHVHSLQLDYVRRGAARRG